MNPSRFKKVAGSIALGALLAFALPLLCAAATTKTAGTMTVTLSVSPNDDPIALEGAAFDVAFKDSSNYFTLKRCNCTLSVLNENGREVFSSPINQNPTFADKEVTSTIPYTFTKTGVYTIVIRGTSLNQSFRPFEVSFTQEIATKHVTEFQKKVKKMSAFFFDQILPLLFLLLVIPLGYKFIIIGKGR